LDVSHSLMMHGKPLIVVLFWILKIAGKKYLLARHGNRFILKDSNNIFEEFFVSWWWLLN
jgi:hypothetical protein